MPNSLENHIDFDEWSTLASTDPEKFEQLRQDRITDFIESISEDRQQRLRGLQWQIDQTRAKHKGSSVSSCVAISNLMWKMFYKLSDTLQSQANNEPLNINTQISAKILSFQKNKLAK